MHMAAGGAFMARARVLDVNMPPQAYVTNDALFCRAGRLEPGGFLSLGMDLCAKHDVQANNLPVLQVRKSGACGAQREQSAGGHRTGPARASARTVIDQPLTRMWA